MNLTEDKEAKLILEKEIREMLGLFEQSTGCRVCDIIVRDTNVGRLDGTRVRFDKRITLEVQL